MFGYLYDCVWMSLWLCLDVYDCVWMSLCLCLDVFMTVFGCHLPSCLPICPAFPPHHSTPPGSTTTPTPPRSTHPAHPTSLSLCLSVSVFLCLFSHASTSQFVLIKVFVFYKACMICPLQINIHSRTDSYLFACCIPVTFNTLDGTEFCKKGT